MKILKISFIIIFLVSITACRSMRRSNDLEKVQIIKVIAPTEAEVVFRGQRQIVTLEGIYFIDKNRYTETYLKKGLIDKKYNKEILHRFESAENYFRTLVSRGDHLYALEPNPQSQTIKSTSLIIYMPNHVSVNELIVREGYAFPVKEMPAIAKHNDFYNTIHLNFKEAVKARRGLWRIGELVNNIDPKKTQRVYDTTPSIESLDNTDADNNKQNDDVNENNDKSINGTK